MKVSIIVPCRNEVDYIDQFISSLLEQDCAGDVQFVIADGCSTDGTRDKLAAAAQGDRRFFVIDNKSLTTPTALNRAILAAEGDIIVRMDVHTSYDRSYISQCVKILNETHAVCVGGPWVPKGHDFVQKAIAAAFSSRFGSGGALSRQIDYNGPVDTVYLGAWRKADLIRIGMFDEFFVRNQDDELNLRVARLKGIIWQSSSIKSWYTPRNSLRKLWRQFFQYGYWKVPVIRKHRLPASARQLAPFGFLAAITCGIAISPFFPIGGIGAIVLAATYLISSLIAAIRCQNITLPMIPYVMAAFACMHFGYGLGFIKGIADFVVVGKHQPPELVPLSR